MDFRIPQVFQKQKEPQNVEDRVEAAHFVKVDPGDVLSVCLRFRLHQDVQGAFCLSQNGCRGPRVDPCGVEKLAQLFGVAVSRRLLAGSEDGSARKGSVDMGEDLDANVPDPGSFQSREPVQEFLSGSESKKGSQEHVAADAGEMGLKQNHEKAS